MSRRKKNKNNRLLDHGKTLWQSGAYNQSLYMDFQYQILSLAMSRFRWLNLPPGVNPRYLEWILITQGMATIAFPPSQPGMWYGTMVAMNGHPNLYDMPSSWESYGNNGWRFSCNNNNGVVMFENTERYPLLFRIDLYAHELTDVKMAKRVNRQHVKTPYVLKAPRERKLDLENTVKQILGGEVAVLQYDSIDAVQTDTIDTGVEFLGEQMNADLKNVWNEIYTFLGIQNIPMKSERQIEDEVRSYQEPSSLMALSSLNARREACKKLNERFGAYLEKPVEVVWNTDLQSDNFNFSRDVKEQAATTNADVADDGSSKEKRTGDIQ